MPRTLALLLLPAILAQAQTSSPNGPAPQTPTLRANARLVLVDVVVTDSHRMPVHDLKASDFTLLENNTPQVLKSFEEHTAPFPAAAPTKLPKLPPGLVTNQSPLNIGGGAQNILLLDTLNTPLRDQNFVHDQLLEYLKSSRPGTSVAIFGLGTRLFMLQGFTADTEVLKRALTRKAGKASPLLDDPAGISGVSDPLSDQMADTGLAPPQLVANLKDFEDEQKSFQLQSRTKYTLDALNTLARYLAGIPGRKNLIWFSGSFPLSILPAETTGDPFAGTATTRGEFQETVTLLSQAQVAVYPVDARGLMTSPTGDAANSGSRSARNPANFLNGERDFATQTAGEHATMLQMAADTGGKAFLNTNGLAQAVASAIDLGSNYYTLAYSPIDGGGKRDSFHKIQLKLERTGFTLAYRRGYYPDDPDSSSAPAVDAMRSALTHGAPPFTQIPFNARVLPSSSAQEPRVSEGNIPAQTRRAEGPFRRYTITWAADPSRIPYRTAPDGTLHGAVDFIALIYDGDGTLINSQSNNVGATLTPVQYANMQHGTLGYRQQISVPVQGDYFLRLVVRDRDGQQIGATEIPIADVSNLPPPSHPK